MNTMIISPADKSDISRLALLESECFPDPWSVFSIQSALETPGYIIVKAVFEGEICGVLTALAVLDEVSILRVAVSENKRRSGIAKKMLLYLEEITEETAGVYFLEVRESNEAAAALYKSLGYRETGQRKNFYENPRENAVLMLKNKEFKAC